MWPWANDASGGPPAQTKARGLGRERRVPPFSDSRIQRPSLPMSGWGGPPPPLHPPLLNPHLNCEGIWICNIRLQRWGGGGFGSGLGIWKVEQGLGCPAGQRAGRPEMAVGEEGGPPKGPPVWVWNVGLGDQAWRPGSRIQPAASLGSEVSTSPSQGLCQ